MLAWTCKFIPKQSLADIKSLLSWIGISGRKDDGVRFCTCVHADEMKHWGDNRSIVELCTVESPASNPGFLTKKQHKQQTTNNHHKQIHPADYLRCMQCLPHKHQDLV